jgi:hypothetical protein
MIDAWPSVTARIARNIVAAAQSLSAGAQCVGPQIAQVRCVIAATGR